MSKVFNCSKCNKEYKKKVYLDKHELQCSVEPETVEEVKEDTLLVEEVKVVLGDDVERKIKKLRDARLSTMDAEARHNIECEIRELEKGV